MLQELTSDTVKSLNLTDKFALTPVLYFKTNKEVCPHCHTRLKVYRTDRRKIYLLDIGQCEAHRTFMYCQDCDRVFESEDFEKRIPPCANVGYDVLVFTGRLILCEHRTIKEAVLELKKRNVHISPSQVAYLAEKFIVYLSILHLQSTWRIKQHITDKGGYILHVDGTCDGGSPHLISAIDEVSHFVLANVKVPTESKERLVPFLEQIKEQYAIPLAVSSDMGRGLLNSIAEVFPGVPHFICHFHFLRDIGKDLLENEYALIRKKLKSYKISAKLRYRIGYEFGDNPKKIHVSEIYQAAQSMAPINTHDHEAIKQLCHVLLLWALDGKKHGDGLGFPFDRPHAEFYRRLCLLWEQLDSLKNKGIENKPLLKCVTRIIDDLAPLVNDTQCLTAYRGLTKKQSVFEDLRQALSIALPNKTIGLNDEGQDIDMGTIEKRVILFKDNLIKAKGYQKSTAYQKLIAQIDKYWEKLFCDPIKVSTPHGVTFIQPQRTNNVLEQFFRGMRRSYRRTTGNNSMRKKLQSIIADTPLVKNLDNPEYWNLICNGKGSLEEAFAEICQQDVISKMKEAKNEEPKTPRDVLLLIRENETMKKVLYLIAS